MISLLNQILKQVPNSKQMTFKNLRQNALDIMMNTQINTKIFKNAEIPEMHRETKWTQLQHKLSVLRWCTWHKTPDPSKLGNTVLISRCILQHPVKFWFLSVLRTCFFFRSLGFRAPQH